MKIYITDGGRKRMIGEIDGGVYRKSVSMAKHLYRVLDAWGIDAEVFKKLLEPVNATIEVYDEDHKKTYTITASEVDKLETDGDAKYMHFKPHRAQVFIPRKFWRQL